MSDRERVTNVVYRAIDHVNEQLAAEERIRAAPDTEILGASATLDSLGFVNLIVAVESGLEAEFGKPFLLVDETLSLDEGPFSTVGTLVDHVMDRMEQEKW